MKLPKIFDHFKQGQIFTIDEAREKLGTTGNTLRKRLSELAAKNYIQHIRQGLYRVASIDHSLEGFTNSPFAIASKLTPYCYVAYRSALQLHANETPEENETIFIVSPTKFNYFKFEGRGYYWCQTPEPQGLETIIHKQNELEITMHATNFEKTLVDCLKRPAHCPSLSEIIRLCGKIPRFPDLDRVLHYASDCNVQSIFNRLGFLFEHHEKKWDVHEEVFNRISNKMSKKRTEWPILFNSEESFNHEPNIIPFDSSKSRWKINFPNLNQ